MRKEELVSTTQLRRKLAKLKHEDLKGIDYAKSKIFKTCETADCGSYICNLSSGSVEEVHGLASLLPSKESPFRTVEDLDHLTHPEDRKKIHEILEALCELGKAKKINSDDRLSITYSIKFQDRYIQVNRKSGLAMNKSTGEVFNFSNLYAMPNMVPLDNVLYRWTGRDLTHKDLMTYLIQKKKKIFTSKELEILTLLLDEKSTDQMADSLYVSRETLKKHFSNMFKKSGTSNRRQLLRFIRESLKN